MYYSEAVLLHVHPDPGTAEHGAVSGERTIAILGGRRSVRG